MRASHAIPIASSQSTVTAATGSGAEMRSMASRTIAPIPISKAIPFAKAAGIVARPRP